MRKKKLKKQIKRLKSLIKKMKGEPCQSGEHEGPCDFRTRCMWKKKFITSII